MVSTNNIDIKEGRLRQVGDLLNILLLDHTTKKNIIWATDSYQKLGKVFAPKKQIKPELVTSMYEKLIQPRAAKSLNEQQQRTKEKAEVFTPLLIVNKINKVVDNTGHIKKPTDNNWQDYVRELKLEITCGEAPFIVSRYDPTTYTDKLIKLEKRVGFLDRKLQVISKYCNKKKDWLDWAREAYKSSYGYEWQGDNILIARENLLYTFIDNYKNIFNRRPSITLMEEFATIISWNIFQMDGLKYVVPMSCHHETRVTLGAQTLFEKIPDKVEKHECEGCKFNRSDKHNGKYVKIIDWEKNKTVRFVDLLNSLNL